MSNEEKNLYVGKRKTEDYILESYLNKYSFLPSIFSSKSEEIGFYYGIPPFNFPRSKYDAYILSGILVLFGIILLYALLFGKKTPYR